MNNCPQCKHPLSGHEVFCEECGVSLERRKDDALIGQNLLGQYMVKRRLGEGGFGAVYEAEQPSMRRKIAIKTLHPHLARRTKVLARFRREGLAASKIQHPAAVKMYNLGETEDGTPWLAMEFVEGRSLEDRLKEGPLSLTEAQKLLFTLCDVLQEAHQKGIIHRDLKPPNVMLLPDELGGTYCKLLDFGIASLLEGEAITEAGAISGTPAYMSPEQWKGLSQTDARTDIYALGIIAYQCLSGSLPFRAENPSAWAIKHCEEIPKELSLAASTVPGALSSVIMKALQKDPAQRYQTALEMKNALEAAFAPPAPTVQAPRTLQPLLPTPPPPPPWRWIATSLALLLLLIAYFVSGPSTTAPTQDIQAMIKQAANEAEAGNYDKAISLLDQAKAINPQEPKIYLLEASIYQVRSTPLIAQENMQGLIYLEKACQSFIKYMQLAPNAPEVPQLREMLQEISQVVPACSVPL